MSIEVVKQVFEAFGAGDMPGLLDLMSEEVQWDHRGPPGVPINGLYQGRKGVSDFFETFGQTQEVLKMEPREYFEAENRVVVLGVWRFRVIETGKEWGSDFAMAYTVEDGLVTQWRPIHDMGEEAAAHQP